jgi:hypothetical protein
VDRRAQENHGTSVQSIVSSSDTPALPNKGRLSFIVIDGAIESGLTCTGRAGRAPCQRSSMSSSSYTRRVTSKIHIVVQKQDPHLATSMCGRTKQSYGDRQKPAHAGAKNSQNAVAHCQTWIRVPICVTRKTLSELTCVGPPLPFCVSGGRHMRR